MKTKHNAIPIIGRNRHLLIACCILLASCAEADLLYPGFVQILPNRSLHALSKVEYRFYNEDTCLVRGSDDEGNFMDQLRSGSYRVLATNVDATGVAFSGLESYDAAQATRSTLVSSELSSVYSVVVDHLEVPDNGTVRREPLPALLTKQLALIFSLQDELDTEIATISGELFGVYPSVYLATGMPSEESVEQSLSTPIRFKVVEQGVQRSVQFGLFGLHDPEKEPVYTNDLSLTLTLNNESKEETTIPLTDILSDIIGGNNGVFPARVSIFIELRKQANDVAGRITAWADGEKETIIMEGPANK